HLGKVVEATPQNGWAQTRLAEAMLVAGEIDPALRHAEAAVAALPDDPAARAVRAAAYFSTGRSEAALTDARAALAADPAQPLAAQVLVRDRLVAREMEAALALIDGFLVRIPDDFELNRLRLGVLAEIQSAARLSAADPSNPELADPELAAALGAQLVRMTELAPEIPDYWTLLMQWHVQNGDLRRAFE
ncbi:MAG: tetratricopeptide repeat protein, partial [Pseudomonadota bacterium]